MSGNKSPCTTMLMEITVWGNLVVQSAPNHVRHTRAKCSTCTRLTTQRRHTWDAPGRILLLKCGGNNAGERQAEHEALGNAESVENLLGENNIGIHVASATWRT